MPAFAAFAEYRDLGSERSLNQVRIKLGKSQDLMERWSSRWSWVERAKAYDAHIDAIKLAAREQAQAKQAAKIMSADEVKQGLTRIAEFDIGELLDERGSFDVVSAKSRGLTKQIKSLKFDKDTGGIVALEAYSAHEGYRDMGKAHAIFVEKIESKVTTETINPVERAGKSVNMIEEWKARKLQKAS